ncbi:hypothetical protein BDV23DRAFT_161594 [Aspergillus alliaceus]|uniref:Uncharacterized protein n=1 Tax=Petromyces alliaceus TaxID=209559 RepID=A0A5N7BZA4_PETAA|nr:hypothetical protein BDV23DRAFT_161594 [Aspergillus alliaceus]
MARFEEQFQNSPLLSTQQYKIGSFEPSPKYKCDAYPIPFEISDCGFYSKSLCNDNPVLAHSSAQYNDLNGSCSSSKVSMKSVLSEIKKQLRILSSEVSQDFLLFKPPRRADSRRLAGVPASNTFSEDIDNFSQRTKGLTKSRPYIMPLLRKVSREPPSTALDFSRASPHHHGLGSITNCEKGDNRGDPDTIFMSRKNFPGLHHRSTSGTSQFPSSTSPSMNNLGSQNIHQMRQGTHSHTPQLSQSYQTSIFDSDASGKGDSAEGELLGRSSSNAFLSSVRRPSGQTPRLSLQTHSNSFTILPGISQTNITSRSSFGYSRDNGSTLDTTSPISRSSLDFVFRSKTRTSTDPISRAATVQAARQAFEEKEAAKTRRFEEQQMKAEEKEMKRKEKHHWRASSKDEEAPGPVWEKEPPGETPNFPPASDPISSTAKPRPSSGSWKSQSKSTWMLFLTWLRTRIFKLRRRIRNFG